jgi:molybdenum cofactor synthesis domain-containing protein
MEAINAVLIALSVAYDLLKMIDKNMQITHVRLTEKTGGKSDSQLRIKEGLRASIATFSDAIFAGNKANKAAEELAGRLQESGLVLAGQAVLPLASEKIRAFIEQQIAEEVDFIFTLGGAGVAGHELVPEIIAEISDKSVPALGEAMRYHGRARTPLALFTRPMAAVKNRTLIVALPGSTSGARESLDAIWPDLFKAHRMLQKKEASF